jgi:hypothetical protein
MHTKTRHVIPPDEIRDIAGGLNNLLKRIDCSWHDRSNLRFLATAEDRLIGPDAQHEIEQAVAAVIETVSAVPVLIDIRGKSGLAS